MQYQLRPPLLALAIAAYLSGCASVTDKTAQTPPVTTAKTEEKPATPPYKGGGYYKDDGPGREIPANLDQIPNAVPKPEPLHRYANDPYKVMGKTYQPLAADKPYKEKGLASWYGRKYHGRKTSSGETYDMFAMSAAHPTLPIPSYARVTNQNNGQSVLVRINDRGPFHEGRIIDLSYTAAYKLDVLKEVTPVEVEMVSAEAAPDSFIAQTNAPISEVVTTPVVTPEITPVALVQPEPLPTPAGGTLYLQLGAFSSQASAEALVGRANAKLARDVPGVQRVEVGGLHKVQVGPFASPAAAELAATRIYTELAIQPIKVAAKAPIVAAAVSAPGHYLQLAALSSPAAAEALSVKVKARFGAGLPGISQITAGALIKVQAGPFSDAAAAEQLAQAYLQDFGVKPYKVVR